MSQLLPTIADIEAARVRIDPWVHRTPLMRSSTISELAGRDIAFKCEMFQRVGAFKFRGACNAVMALSDEAAKRGVATHSSGNHAQALALAARLRGIPAYVVMPRGSPAVKRSAVVGYGAAVIECEPTLAAREAACQVIIERTGATLIHPYDNCDVIAGQATIALEILEQAPDTQAIIAPVGGGGLISGIAIAAKHSSSSLQVLAAEPELAADAALGKRTGRLQPPMLPVTIADGLRTALSVRTFAAVSALVDEIVEVPEADIAPCMRLLWERAKLMAEPSSAVALAALLTPEFRARKLPERIVVVLSGGNVDLDQLPWQIS
ncbi:MAG: pyridoxal-phosphate dependent enzyme [Phycisphaerales bacterium]|nr:pyridoxal-phosphate dependent enzyme [Phycisphaerales bacterium]